MTVGSEQTRLIVLRGNSGAGKSTVARALRDAYGRGMAWVSQDLIRRIILREHDRPGAANIGLIDQVARYSLDHGYHVVLDGIFCADRYEPMLAALNRDHLGVSRFYYLDVSMEEALRRHATRPQAAEFSKDDMRRWYRTGDLLGVIREHVIPESSTLPETVSLILAETQVTQARMGHGHADHHADAAPGPRGASVVVTSLAPEGRVYLLLRPSDTEPDESGWPWVLPGGRREPGENIADCAARELREETGIAARPLPVDADGLSWAVFRLDVPWPTAIRLSGEHAEADWVPLAEAFRRCPAAALTETIARAAGR